MEQPELITTIELPPTANLLSLLINQLLLEPSEVEL
jgi:hypothetical protein